MTKGNWDDLLFWTLSSV